MKISEKQVKNAVSSVRNELMITLVNTPFGIKHNKREILIAHICPIVKILHDNPYKISLIEDDTYAYI